MCTLQLIPGNTTRSFSKGTLLLDALMEMGVTVKTPCGGKGICGKCRTRVSGALSQFTASEEKALGEMGSQRLACQACLVEDVHVFIDEETGRDPSTYPRVNPNDRYAIAVDIGTTSVTIALVNITDGTTFDLDAFLNPQRRFGHDVISRIAAAKDPSVRQTLTFLIRRSIFSAMEKALGQMDLPCTKVEQIVFSGNTAMLYFLFGLDVSPLGSHPFHAKQLDFDGFSPEHMGCDQFANARISAIPAAGPFLGGDLVGGLAICHEKGFHENTFFIDLGTNGELFLINPFKAIYAASCAMGPALEGMNISSGMTADDGAVTHAWIDDGAFQFKMIGAGPPRGLTGTALIDLTSLFLSKGLILGNGAFADDLENRSLPQPARYSHGSQSKRIFLWGDIAISQQDIRNLQLAKGASLTASRLLLHAAESTAADVQNVVISGAFGTHLNLDSFNSLGFIPRFSQAGFHYLGNTSLLAASRACTDADFVQTAIRIRQRISEVNLSMDPSFHKEFIRAIRFGA